MPKNNSQGSVVITIVLFMVILMTSSAIVLSGTLSRHIRASQDYLSSEKAFAGANSGVEEMLYQFRKKIETAGKIENGAIPYSDGDVSYKGDWKVHPVDAKIPCMRSAGTYRSLVRHIKLGGDACAFE